MQTYFYNLSGGINKSCSKTALGVETSKLYWTESENIEVLQNSGIVRQNGNILFFQLENEEQILATHELKERSKHNLIIITNEGNIYVLNCQNLRITKVSKTVDTSSRFNIVDYLDGVVIGSNSEPLFYVNNDDDYAVESCNLKDAEDNDICSSVITVYGGRLWVAKNATLYFSALGRYDDFEAEQDAGYINNFHTDTFDITALKPYKDYLAIYKENSVYLLSGTNYSDFKIIPFADKGTHSFSSTVNVNNKQYFLSENGVFCLEQSGLLSQIALGKEISINIKSEFENFDKTRYDEIIILHYERKNQIWFFIPYKNSQYFSTIWIFDYITQAWFKRVLPQQITTACIYNENILTADATGKIYQEDFGNTFDGKEIKFLWKSPFLATGKSNIRKTIEEFYFVLDESYDNNFNFSVCKNYDEREKSDEDKIESTNFLNLIWGDSTDEVSEKSNWSDETINLQWAIGTESIYKAEISESNYSVQLCVEGSSLGKSVAIIGLEFKEIYLDE